MPKVLDHMTGALYRIGLHHEDGAASVLALSAHPIRATVGELGASAADLIVHARGGPGGGGDDQAPPVGDIGPSTV